MSVLEGCSNPRQALNSWLAALGGALPRLGAAESGIRLAGAVDSPANGATLWWKGSAGEPSRTVWVGAPQAAWRSVAERALESGEARAEQLYVELLNESWGIAGELVESHPPCTRFEAVEISFAQAGTVQLLVGFEGELASGSTLGVLLDVELPVTLRFGRTQMALAEVMSLNAGSTIEFDRRPEEPVEVMVNGHVIARGEAVIVKGNYGVRIMEIASRRERLDMTSGGAGLDGAQL